jgi:hypothetical protein
MKLLVVCVVLYGMCWQVSGILSQWKPAWVVVFSGQVVGNSAILGVLGTVAAVSVTLTGYRVLSYLLD